MVRPQRPGLGQGRAACRLLQRLQHGRRGSLLREVRARFPGLACWADWCYSSSSTLRFGQHKLQSCCGVQQGDPLGPLLFALALHPALRAAARHPVELCFSYLDDVVLAGRSDAVQAAFRDLQAAAAAAGLVVEVSKCVLVPTAGQASCVDASAFPAGLNTRQEGDFELLGAPIDPEFCESYTAVERVDKSAACLAALGDLEDSQTGLLLLRYCSSFSKRLCTACAPRPRPLSRPPCSASTRGSKPARACWGPAAHGQGLAAGHPQHPKWWSWTPASRPPALPPTWPLLGFLPGAKNSMPAMRLTGPLQPLLWSGSTLPCWLPTASLLQRSARPDSRTSRPPWTEPSWPSCPSPLPAKQSGPTCGFCSNPVLVRGCPPARPRHWGCTWRPPSFRFCSACGSGFCPLCDGTADRFGDHARACPCGGDRVKRHNRLRTVVATRAASAGLAPRLRSCLGHPRPCRFRLGRHQWPQERLRGFVGPSCGEGRCRLRGPQAQLSGHRNSLPWPGLAVRSPRCRSHWGGLGPDCGQNLA